MHSFGLMYSLNFELPMFCRLSILGIPHRTCAPLLVAWVYPMHGWVKIDFDYVYMDSFLSIAARSVFQDPDGHFLYVFYAFFDIPFAFDVEFWSGLCVGHGFIGELTVI